MQEPEAARFCEMQSPIIIDVQCTTVTVWTLVLLKAIKVSTPLTFTVSGHLISSRTLNPRAGAACKCSGNWLWVILVRKQRRKVLQRNPFIFVPMAVALAIAVLCVLMGSLDGGFSVEVGIGIGIGGGSSGSGSGSPPPPEVFGSDECSLRLYQAFLALQAWKRAIVDDPFGVTASWEGTDVCSYTGVFCAPSLDNLCSKVVAGIDLNQASLKGILVEELGLLQDLGIFHLNSNRFTGTLPLSFKNLQLLAELDVSNNELSGYFPAITLAMPSLIYLDLRFNSFIGPVPGEVFERKFDAIFLNNNCFQGQIPYNLGNSPASVISFANNQLQGIIPESISNMGGTLNEILFLGNGLSGCLPHQLGRLSDLTVLDLAFNNVSGTIPLSLSCCRSLEQLVLSHNEFFGDIPELVCSLPSLNNLSVSFNYFTSEGRSCSTLGSYRGVAFDDSENCIPGRPRQRPVTECSAFAAKPKSCDGNLTPDLKCSLPCPTPSTMKDPAAVYASLPPPRP